MRLSAFSLAKPTCCKGQSTVYARFPMPSDSFAAHGLQAPVTALALPNMKHFVCFILHILGEQRVHGFLVQDR